MQPQLLSILESIKHEGTREFVRGVFEDLRRLLGYLDGVKEAVGAVGATNQALFIFEAVRCEALATAGGLDYFCACLDAPDALSEELERTSFAVRHELRAVFERLLPCAHAAEAAEETCSLLAEAHDLLRNCFEQSTVSLARTFRADVDAADIFEDIRAKRDNSLRLYEDLNALLRSARYAEWHDDAEALVNFSERVELFRVESMRHLMQKDQETCQNFVDGLVLLSDRRTLRLFLHRFNCYLEILLKHVSMRSVLAETSLCVAA
ncbi:MAG: hypothetical protein QOH49_218 [Acidobacteriota bacterium]|jgi:hypothetical protein|nr:hypothetical protein [Acidobacteriota bacterium]